LFTKFCPGLKDYEFLPIRNSMSSLAPVNPGVADLLRTPTVRSGPLPASRILASTTAQSDLEQASPGDVVQLSPQAVQLQQATDQTPASQTLTQQDAAVLFAPYSSSAPDISTIRLLG